MRIKSYFAATIREAIDNARTELGPEAMIIASRKTNPDQQSRGEYEVVCGVTGEPGPMERPAERTPPVAAVAPQSRDVRSLLDKAGIPTDIISDLVSKFRSVGRRRVVPPPLNEVTAELRARLQTSAELGRPGCARKVVAVVGPPGAGKTTTIVKLAVKYGLTASKPMHIISMDGYRVAGADALRTYSAAMGIGFDALETAASLAQTLEQHAGKGLILIDTPGLGPKDLAGAAQLASFFSRSREIDVHLVLPATMSADDMKETFTRFRPCLPEKLIFTGLDMASTCGTALSFAMRMEKPISFLGTGQQIPEDLEAADTERLIHRLIPEAAIAGKTSAA